MLAILQTQLTGIADLLHCPRGMCVFACQAMSELVCAAEWVGGTTFDGRDDGSPAGAPVVPPLLGHIVAILFRGSCMQLADAQLQGFGTVRPPCQLHNAGLGHLAGT